MLKHLIVILFLLFLTSCSNKRKKEIVVSDNYIAKINTEFDSFEMHESIYCGIYNARGDTLFNQQWIFATGYNETKMEEYNAELIDSIIIVKWKEMVLEKFDLREIDNK